eukprot:391380_1
MAGTMGPLKCPGRFPSPVRLCNMRTAGRLLLLSMLFVVAQASKESVVTPAGGVDDDGNVKKGWIDPATNVEDYTFKSRVDGRVHKLVMSDEFETEGRLFKDGCDPTWTAETHQDDSMNSAGLGALHYYNYSYASTKEGLLDIKTTSEKTRWRGYNPYKRKYETLEKEFRSALLSSWNKFCFTGGIIEARMKLPGKARVGGLWPAFWLLGNLGRATYEGSTNLVWPWSFDVCDRELQPAQEISACNAVKHFGFNPKQGRGSTEIDIVEVMPGAMPEKLPKWDTVGKPYQSFTLQVAPGISDHRPNNEGPLLDNHKWYKGVEYGENTSINPHFYGMLIGKTSPEEPVYRTEKQSYKADGISALASIDDTHFEDFHLYSLEWQPGPDGYISWYRDGELMQKINAESLNITGAQIPEEPSYIILNTAVSNAWGFPQTCPEGCTCSCYDCNDLECACSFYDGFCDMLPVSMQVDYVRVYQDEDDERHELGCDTRSHPTKRWIKAHEGRYISEGNKYSLLPIIAGGSSCSVDADCGYGHCSSSWAGFVLSCVCKKGYTGPNCLVPDYQDTESLWPVKDVRPVYMKVPTVLIVLATIILIGYASSVISISLGKHQTRYRYSKELQKARATWIKYS